MLKSLERTLVQIGVDPQALFYVHPKLEGGGSMVDGVDFANINQSTVIAAKEAVRGSPWQQIEDGLNLIG